MKWTQVFCLLAIAVSGVASADEFDAPSAPSLPGGPAPIFDNDSYQGTQQFAVSNNSVAPPNHAATAQPGPPHGAADCLHCNGGMRQCCQQEASCCDNVWDNYCAEKVDWCHRGRRPFFRSLTDCFPEDSCGCCNCRKCTFRACDGGLQARLKKLRGGRGCAQCGDAGCAGCAGGCAAATQGCACQANPQSGGATPHYHAPVAPIPHTHLPQYAPAPEPTRAAPSPDFSTPPAAPVIESAPVVNPAPSEEPPMIDPEPEAPRSARRAPLQFEDAFHNILRWKQR